MLREIMTREEEARQYRQQIAAALVLPGRGTWCEGELDGVPVFIFCYCEDNKDVTPLLVVLNDELLARVKHMQLI